LQKNTEVQKIFVYLEAKIINIMFKIDISEAVYQDIAYITAHSFIPSIVSVWRSAWRLGIE